MFVHVHVHCSTWDYLNIFFVKGLFEQLIKVPVNIISLKPLLSVTFAFRCVSSYLWIFSSNMIMFLGCLSAWEVSWKHDGMPLIIFLLQCPSWNIYLTRALLLFYEAAESEVLMPIMLVYNLCFPVFPYLMYSFPITLKE